LKKGEDRSSHAQGWGVFWSLHAVDEFVILEKEGSRVHMKSSSLSFWLWEEKRKDSTSGDFGVFEKRQEQSCTGTDGVLVTPWHLFLVILEKRVQGVV
jgi:hypothetical protein